MYVHVVGVGKAKLKITKAYVVGTQKNSFSGTKNMVELMHGKINRLVKCHLLKRRFFWYLPFDIDSESQTLVEQDGEMLVLVANLVVIGQLGDNCIHFFSFGEVYRRIYGQI